MMTSPKRRIWSTRLRAAAALLLGLGSAARAEDRPALFVDATTVVPELQVDLRYASAHNFVGRPISGYHAPVCWLTRPAAEALREVQLQLLPMGLGLKVYDCYRPEQAVADFAAWAAKLDDTAMQAEFYPDMHKSALFHDGYIASKSGHSRGSTVDLTIVPRGSAIPPFDAAKPLVSCAAPAEQRFPDNSLDFGTGYDCFSPLAHPDAQQPSAQARANRLLLRTLMEHAGFKPLSTEWWHFTLREEPYPETYFNFPVAQP